MKKINNPFQEIPGYNCFGCAPDNPRGLKLEFFREGDEVVARWQPEGDFQGFKNALHGGIQAALLDEIACWAVFALAGKGGVTARLEIRYRHPVSCLEGPVTLRARILEVRRSLATVAVWLYDASGRLCSGGKALYALLPAERSEVELYYPGPGAFETP